ncbi:MAG: SelT/SelW/SelH family protein [Pseudomonadota bacterium]
MSDKADRPPEVVITYCTGCNWLLRAGWMAQELLQTFAADLAAVTLRPDASGGVFEITLAGEVVWERRRDGGFPDAAQHKSLIRDRLAPDRDLGHIDRAGEPE